MSEEQKIKDEESAIGLLAAIFILPEVYGYEHD